VQHFLVAALSLALSAPQQSTASAPAQASALQLQSVSTELAGRWQELYDLTRPRHGPLGLEVRVSAADAFAEMALLADAGVGPARAWCARHLGALPAESATWATEASQHFMRLVQDHGGESWLLDPAFDPLTSLERAPEAVRQSLEDSLAALEPGLDHARDLALALRAVAIAPRSTPDDTRRARALALLAELEQSYPTSPWRTRAERLAWRIARLSPGQQAPELAVPDVDGNRIELSLLRGRPVLIDAWSTDDPDLLQRVAERRALLERFPAARIAVVGIGRGAEDALTFRRLLEELDLPWPTAFERTGEAPAEGAWPLDASPLSVLIDARGDVRAVGLEGAELEQALEQLLAAPAGAGALQPQPSRPRAALRAVDR
jgi:peroxiredoxin